MSKGVQVFNAIVGVATMFMVVAVGVELNNVQEELTYTIMVTDSTCPSGIAESTTEPEEIPPVEIVFDNTGEEYWDSQYADVPAYEEWDTYVAVDEYGNEMLMCCSHTSQGDLTLHQCIPCAAVEEMGR